MRIGVSKKKIIREFVQYVKFSGEGQVGRRTKTKRRRDDLSHIFRRYGGERGGTGDGI